MSALSRWFHQRAEVNAGRVRRVMIVAMARKLLIALWRYATLGVLPEGAVLENRLAGAGRSFGGVIGGAVELDAGVQFGAQVALGFRKRDRVHGVPFNNA
jgi:hypothetical protein